MPTPSINKALAAIGLALHLCTPAHATTENIPANTLFPKMELWDNSQDFIRIAALTKKCKGDYEKFLIEMLARYPLKDAWAYRHFYDSATDSIAEELQPSEETCAQTLKSIEELHESKAQDRIMERAVLTYLFQSEPKLKPLPMTMTNQNRDQYPELVQDTVSVIQALGVSRYCAIEDKYQLLLEQQWQHTATKAGVQTQAQAGAQVQAAINLIHLGSTLHPNQNQGKEVCSSLKRTLDLYERKHAAEPGLNHNSLKELLDF